jgi:hypothetical protein
VRSERRGFSEDEIPTRQLSLQSVATGGVVEIAKRSKPSVESFDDKTAKGLSVKAGERQDARLDQLQIFNAE